MHTGTLTGFIDIGDIIVFINSYCHGQITAAAKTTRSLSYLKHSLWGETHSAKVAACVSLGQPLLEYACTVWNPHTCKDQLLLEQVQLRAGCWVCGSRWSPVPLENDQSHLPTVFQNCLGQSF